MIYELYSIAVHWSNLVDHSFDIRIDNVRKIVSISRR